MPYHGPLQPATRYYYKVRVWDNHNRESESKEDSWFETGLGVTDQQAWCGAQWIGSSKVLLSPYRSTFIVDYDTEDTSAFIFGKRGDMYCQVALKGGQLIISHFIGGKEIVDGCGNVAHVLQPGIQHVKLNVFSSQYARTYRMDIFINGQKLRTLIQILPNNPRPLKRSLQPVGRPVLRLSPHRETSSTTNAGFGNLRSREESRL